MNIQQKLGALEAQGMLRKLRALPGTGGKFVSDGKTFLNFSSNDYLNLANDPRVKAAAVEMIERFGCGATASRLMSGHLCEHEALETDLARLAGMEAALVFGSGFLTNLGVLAALGGRSAAIFADRLNHASLVDGMLLSRSKCFRYRHNDMNHLEDFLKKHGDAGQRIVVSDSVFSMDGDIAPVKDLAELSQRYDARLVIDEAHAIGVIGPNGSGVCRRENVQPDIIVGTLSKSLGGYGGFAACSTVMREYLINRSRSFIYSTGLPPACLGGAQRAIAIIESESDLGRRLLAGARRLCDGLAAAGFQVPQLESQILPVHVGENAAALAFSQALWKRSVLAVAIRPPTVPAGTSRLRMSVTLAHTDADLQQTVGQMTSAAREVGGIL